MANYKTIGTSFDRTFRNDLNDNFKTLDGVASSAKADTQVAKQAATSAAQSAQQAQQASEEAVTKATTTQAQLDDIILENGQSDAEVVQARGGEPLLYERLNKADERQSESLKYFTTNFNYLNDAKKEKKCIVSFIADDAPKSDLLKLLPVMAEKKVPVGIGVITSRVGSSYQLNENTTIEYMTWEEIKRMELNGAEIMAHSHLHRPSTTLTEKELYEDMKMCKSILNSKGYIADGFIYPNNASSDFTKSVVKRFFKYSFTGSGSRGNFTNLSNNAITRINLGAIGDQPEAGFPQDTLSLEYYKARVDWSIEKNNWLVFVLHTSLDDMLNAQQQTYMKETIDYIRSKGIEIVSPREGFERYGNILQLGEKPIIQADGTQSGVIVEEKDKHTVTSTIDDFQLYTITHTPVTKDPFGNSTNSGILITFNLESIDGRRFQKFISTLYYNGDPIQKVLSRHWRLGGWSAWKNDSQVSVQSELSSASTGLLQKPITDFDNQHITYHPIKPSRASADGYPENSGGTLVTYRLGLDEPHYQYQKYDALIIYGGTDLVRKTFVRYWYNGNWTQWKLESQTSRATS
ncbi:polysaccharide deacetylase family protein [Rossellomorea marisflavi]|uniref:polysaccharide deacetylase family protein n=1 Tax=Rossellomorea marisflavi TaxID=189381 RepID=UPI00345A5226